MFRDLIRLLSRIAEMYEEAVLMLLGFAGIMLAILAIKYHILLIKLFFIAVDFALDMLGLLLDLVFSFI